MTGGALGSLLARPSTSPPVERKTLLVAGACAGMTAVFGTPLAAVLLAVELLLFELRPRSLLPVALACAVAGFLRPAAGRCRRRCSRCSTSRADGPGAALVRASPAWPRGAAFGAC